LAAEHPGDEKARSVCTPAGVAAQLAGVRHRPPSLSAADTCSRPVTVELTAGPDSRQTILRQHTDQYNSCALSQAKTISVHFDPKSEEPYLMYTAEKILTACRDILTFLIQVMYLREGNKDLWTS